MNIAIHNPVNKIICSLVLWSFFGVTVVAQNFIVDRDRTIPLGITEVDNVTYTDQSTLTISGTLIVNGAFNMAQNKASLILEEGARLIVYGNFIADNQVYITLGRDSYLFVYGNFSKGGSSKQDVVIIDNAKIYILGDGDNWGDNLTSCGGNYDGTTNDVNDTCDFGNEEDYENNQDEFPDDLVDQLNCYDLSSISGQEVCESAPASFSVPLIPDVNYQWQVKTADADWNDIVNNNNNTYTIASTSLADNGNLYRVIVKPNISSTSNCKISISRKVTLNVETAGIWNGVEDNNWNNPANWSCSSLPTLNTDVIIPSGLTNYPLVNPGADALAKNLTIENGATVSINNNWLRIAGDLNNNGSLNTVNGNISFEGTSAQSIPSAAFNGNRILNLRIDNPAGVTSQATIEVLNSLDVASGTFSTGNDFTLISNSTRTAFIDGSGAGQVTGTVSMQRYLSNGFGYKYFSSPFSNSTVGDFSPFMDLTNATSGFPHLYEYVEGRKDAENNDLTGWKAYIDTTNPLNIAEGYALNISGDTNPVDIEISGEINNGPVNISLEHNNGLYTKGFNLVGNPYPSPIDWSLMVPTLSGIDNAVYFFKAGASDRYTGTYSSYVNGVYTNATTPIIPSMQGFFVKVSDPGNATLSFTNSVRTDNLNTQDFYKSKNPRVISQIKLAAGFSGQKTSDVAVIYFNNGATADFEKDLDAFKLLNTATEVPSLYSLTKKREKLSINAVSSAETQEIPLGIRTERTGKMFIRLASVENIFPLSYIYLKDLKNKVVHNFSEDAAYSFTSQKGEINDQFSLILSSEKLSKNELRSSLEYFSIHAAQGEIKVKLNLPGNTSGNIILSNISGQVLQNKSGKEKEEIKFEGITVPGVYLISLELKNERFTKKFLLKK